MNKMFYVLLCLMSPYVLAGDLPENNGVEVELEEIDQPNGCNPPRNSFPEIVIDNGLPNLRPDGTRAFAHELANAVYNEQCNSDTFCIIPFQKHLKKLKKDDRNRYDCLTGLLLEKKAERTRAAQRHREVGNVTINDISIELMQFAMKALEEESNLQVGTIQEHEGKIKELRTWGTLKNRGLAAAIASGIILVLGYFGYTITPC